MGQVPGCAKASVKGQMFKPQLGVDMRKSDFPGDLLMNINTPFWFIYP